jgi:F-type H+-transporting ATPase subunit b
MRSLARHWALAVAFTLSLSSLAWAASGDAHDEAEKHGEAAGAHDAHHAPTLHDVNWYYGLLLEREGVEPSLLFRPKGMPVPYLGYVLNALGLYALIYAFAKKPIREGLTRRKAKIEQGMKDAAALRAQARARLEEYEQKLASIEEEVERVRRDMRRDGELERARILTEARARRERMERDARLLVEQELSAVRDVLLRETVQAALRSATETLKARVTPEDHARLADEYLARLPNIQGLSRAQRGSA